VGEEVEEVTVMVADALAKTPFSEAVTFRVTVPV
jgi:hypothetical protein